MVKKFFILIFVITLWVTLTEAAYSFVPENYKRHDVIIFNSQAPPEPTPPPSDDPQLEPKRKDEPEPKDKPKPKDKSKQIP